MAFFVTQLSLSTLCFKCVGSQPAWPLESITFWTASQKLLDNAVWCGVALLLESVKSRFELFKNFVIMKIKWSCFEVASVNFAVNVAERISVWRSDHSSGAVKVSQWHNWCCHPSEKTKGFDTKTYVFLLDGQLVPVNVQKLYVRSYMLVICLIYAKMLTHRYDLIRVLSMRWNPLRPREANSWKGNTFSCGGWMHRG